MNNLEELLLTDPKTVTLPKWAQVLRDSKLPEVGKLYVLLQVLGLSDKEAVCVPTQEQLTRMVESLADGSCERTLALFRSVFFKKPEDELAMLTRKAIEVKRQLLEDPAVPLAVKDKTATDVIDRNIGKAAQTVQIKGTIANVNVDLGALDKDLELTLKRIEQLEAPMKSVKALEAPKTI